MNKGKILTFKHVYNIIADIFTGINFRIKDNIFQLGMIVLGMALSYFGFQLYFKFNDGLLWFQTSEELILPSLILGFFAGAITGGASIAIFRLIKHLKGHHD